MIYAGVARILLCGMAGARALFLKKVLEYIISAAKGAASSSRTPCTKDGVMLLLG